MKRLATVLSLLLLSLSLTGCLSHWFLDSTSRLQVENATEDCTLVGVDVKSEEGSSYKRWIEDSIEPGERSRVVEEDWVGDFTLRIRYTQSVDGSGEEQEFVFDTELDGGSLYLVVENEGDSLKVRFR